MQDITKRSLWAKLWKNLSWISQGSQISQKIASGGSTYIKNRKFVVKLLEKKKREFENDLSVKWIISMEVFCKTVKAPFTNKTLKNERIIIVKMKRMILIEVKLVSNCNEYFESTQKLGAHWMFHDSWLFWFTNLIKH